MEKNDKYNEKLSLVIIEKKIDFFKDVLQKTILHVKKVKNLDVLGESDVTTCIDRLTELSKKINEITEQNIKNTDLLILNCSKTFKKVRNSTTNSANTSVD